MALCCFLLLCLDPISEREVPAVFGSRRSPGNKAPVWAIVSLQFAVSLAKGGLSSSMEVRDLNEFLNEQIPLRNFTPASSRSSEVTGVTAPSEGRMTRNFHELTLVRLPLYSNCPGLMKITVTVFLELELIMSGQHSGAPRWYTLFKLLIYAHFSGTHHLSIRVPIIIMNIGHSMLRCFWFLQTTCLGRLIAILLCTWA